jgi:hypothetical protein
MGQPSQSRMPIRASHKRRIVALGDLTGNKVPATDEPEVAVLIDLRESA